ncbi:MAG: TolC family protein [Rikenellaceae bacterium]|nr:TolC family protein [Rikenellaceae bacterium]
MKRNLILLHTFLLLGLLASGTAAQTPASLQECLELGLENNYSVRIVRNNERITDNNATWANAGALPSVDVSAGSTGRIDDTRTLLREEEHTTDHGAFNHSGNVGLNVGWTLFDGFRIQSNYEKLQELKSLGAIQTRITMEDFVAGLTAEYYNYIQQKLRLENYRYAVSLSQERLRIVEARYIIGSFSRLDLLQARVDFNADSSSYMNQTELVLASRIRLNELMAMTDVTAELPIRDSIILLNKALEWGRLYDKMLATNAELQASARNENLAEIDLKTLRARNYPTLTMNAGYGYSWNGYGTGTTKYRGVLGPSAGISVGFTVFDGNRKREQRNARIEIENARLRRQEMENGLTADLANFWQAYLNNLQVIRLEEENLIAAKENLKIAQERYMLGDLSGIEMREAQQSLLNAEERILSARYNTKLYEISLLLLSGDVLDYLED